MRTNEWNRTFAIAVWSAAVLWPLVVISRAWADPSPLLLNPNGAAMAICADCMSNLPPSGTQIAPLGLDQLQATSAAVARNLNPLLRIAKPRTLEQAIQEQRPQFEHLPIGAPGSTHSFQWNPVTQLPGLPVTFDPSFTLSESKYSPPPTFYLPAPVAPPAPVVAAPPVAVKAPEVAAVSAPIAEVPAPLPVVEAAPAPVEKPIPVVAAPEPVQPFEKLKIWANVPLPSAAPRKPGSGVGTPELGPLPPEEPPTQYSISTIGPDAQPLTFELP